MFHSHCYLNIHILLYVFSLLVAYKLEILLRRNQVGLHVLVLNSNLFGLSFYSKITLLLN